MSTDQTPNPAPLPTPLPAPTPAPTTTQPSTTKFRTPFVISLVTNIALAGLVIWCATRWESRFKEGYYQGQLKTYTQLEMWGLGKVMATSSELQFKLAPKPITVQVYNRNFRPSETDKVQEGR